MSSVDLQMPRNWTRWTDLELREAITNLETRVRAKKWEGSQVCDYLHRLDKARLHCLRAELDRRIERRAV